MHLYHLTLQKPTGILAVAYGSFSGPKVHEIAMACGSSLEVVRPDENGKLQSLGRSETFGQLRSLAAFRLTGAKRDYIIVGSDSGKVTIVQFDGKNGRFDQIHCETFGKSGVRRIVPGQYTVADPRGRACLLAAVEKQKFVYVLNRDASEKLTISSPLEAHKTGVVCYHIAALDVGFENPMFAALERPYEPPGQKVLVLYELDLGLNHAMRKQAVPVDDTASLVCGVPGGGDGPSGSVVCSLGKVSYVSISKEHPVLDAVLPFRQDDRRGRTMITAAALHKQRGMFFLLLCTERGDLMKLELKWSEERVEEVRVKYLDTLPCTAAAMCVLRTGFLFVASEFGDHYFYQFQGVGDDEDPAGGLSTSSMPQPDKLGDVEKSVMFVPRAAMENFLLVDTVQSIAPVLDWQFGEFSGESEKQIATVCGRGSTSSLRLLRRGFAVQEMAVSELPAMPTAVFTMKETIADEHDQFIVVSFVNATLVLRIGETVEEVSQSGLLGDVPTIAAGLLGDDALVQVHANGVRLIRKEAAVTEWKPPSSTVITAAATNPNQIAVSLSSGDLVYFELDAESGNLDEVEKLDLVFKAPAMNGNAGAGGDVPVRPCLAFAKPAEGRSRGVFLAVSDGSSSVARVIAVKQEGNLESVAVQALPSAAESLAILDVGPDQPVLLVGLKSGVLLRLRMDPLSGQIVDKRSRFLGPRPVRLFHVRAGGINTCFALCSTPWILHPQNGGRIAVSPLCSEALDNAASFSSEQCPEGFVAVHRTELRILTLEEPELMAQAALDSASPGVMFNSVQTDLPNTPRRLLDLTAPGHSSSGLLVSIETDQRTARVPDAPGTATGIMGAGKWVSNIRLLTVNREEVQEAAKQLSEEDEVPGSHTLQVIEMPETESALTGCVCTFRDRPEELFLVVAVAQNRVVDATSPLERREKASDAATAELRLFKLEETASGKSLTFQHATPLESPCNALAAFHGRLLAGIGTSLRLYELGKKKLLKRTDCRNAAPNMVVAIAPIGDRVYVADVQESVLLVQYKVIENKLTVVADDNVPRWITRICVVDYHTVFAADKFGNIVVLRLPAELSETLDSDPTGGRLTGAGNQALHKLSVEASFHVGSLVHSLAKVSMGGSSEVLLYATMGGAVGALTPLPVRSDVDLFQQLEISLREAAPPLCGRDHLSYRSYYYPVRNVIDGDLIEQLPKLPSNQQKALAEDADRTAATVLRKIEDVRESIS